MYTSSPTGTKLWADTYRSWSFWGGSVLAWGIIGPAIVTTGKAFGIAISPLYPGYMNYMSMVLEDPVNAPSPRYWLVW